MFKIILQFSGIQSLFKKIRYKRNSFVKDVFLCLLFVGTFFGGGQEVWVLFVFLFVWVITVLEL